MDKYLTKKSKADETISENLDSDGSQSTTSQKSEESKRKAPARKYNIAWENEYFAIENNSKTICLICRMEYSDNKKYAIDRHFTTTHSEINVKFSDPTKRAKEIQRLKNELSGEKKIIQKFLDKNEILACASYRIAFNLAQSAKPYTDGEFYKDLLLSTVKILCQNVDDKTTGYLVENIQLLPLSEQTISRRVNDLGKDIETKLKSDLKKCHSFSLALDETTDIGDTSQLAFWVRYINDINSYEENLLALVPLKEQTRGEDIFNSFLQVASPSRFDLDLKKLVCVCTDGAPAMTAKTKGFVARLKQHLSENGITHKLIAYHCILHQESLCAKAIERGCDVLKTVTEVSIHS